MFWPPMQAMQSAAKRWPQNGLELDQLRTEAMEAFLLYRLDLTLQLKEKLVSYAGAM